MRTRLAYVCSLAALALPPIGAACTDDSAATGMEDAGPGALAPRGCLEVTDDIRSDVVWEKRTTDAGTGDGGDVPDVCVRRDITVQRGTLLTIASGVRVAFDPGASLVVARAEGAALIAAGTATEPITLRGSSAEPGSWDGVKIASSDPRNRVSHVSIQGAGAGGEVIADDTLGGLAAALVLDAEPGAPARAQIDHVTFEDSAGWGLVVEWTSEATGLTNNRFVRNREGAVVLSPQNVSRMDASSTYEGNAFDGVAVTGAPNLEASTPTTWKRLSAGAKYWIREPLEILSNFAIEPGVEIVFAAGTGLKFPQNTTNTRAVVSIVGASDAKISFTGEQPVPGFWDGIEVQTGHPINRVHHAVVAHAKTGIRVRRAGAFPAASLDIANSHVRESLDCGIESTNPDNTLTVTNVAYERNGNDRCPPP